MIDIKDISTRNENRDRRIELTIQKAIAEQLKRIADVMVGITSADGASIVTHERTDT